MKNCEEKRVSLLIIKSFSKIQLVVYYQSASFENQNNGGCVAFCWLTELFCLDIFDQLIGFY